MGVLNQAEGLSATFSEALAFKGPARISRRSVLLGTGAGAGLAFMPGALHAATGRARDPLQGEKPNILWLVSEDNNPYLGAYGDPFAQTPTLDRLAQDGVLYENAYSDAPVCALSRFAILTGVAPQSCGPAHHMRAEATLPAAFQTYPELLREKGYYCSNNAKTDYNATVDPQAIWDAQGPNAHWKNRPEGAPFMAVFNFQTTHESQVFTSVQGAQLPEGFQIPAYMPDTPAIRADFATYYARMAALDQQIAQKLAELEEAGLSDNTIVFYYADNGGVLPRSKRYCYQEGLHCPLIIRLPQRWQGLAPVEQGGKVAAPVTFLDLAPTLAALSGGQVPPQMQGLPLLGAGTRGHEAVASRGYAFGGRNRMDERYDFIRTVTDGRWRYIRNYTPYLPLFQHQAFEWQAKGYQSFEEEHLAGRLTSAQARVFAAKPFEELYDLQADPDQIHNLAEDPSAAAVLNRLSSALDACMIARNDNGFIPEGMGPTGYFESRDKSAYPLSQLMALGRLAAERKASNAEQLAQQLGHQNGIIRYWAALGLRMLGEAAAPYSDALLNIAQADPAAHVRLAASEALAASTADDTGPLLLAEFLAEGTDWRLQLQALNALTFAGGAVERHASLVLPAAEALQQSRVTYVKSAARYLVARLTGRYHPAMAIFDMQAMLAGNAAGGAQ